MLEEVKEVSREVVIEFTVVAELHQETSKQIASNVIIADFYCPPCVD